MSTTPFWMQDDEDNQPLIKFARGRTVPHVAVSAPAAPAANADGVPPAASGSQVRH